MSYCYKTDPVKKNLAALHHVLQGKTFGGCLDDGIIPHEDALEAHSMGYSIDRLEARTIRDSYLARFREVRKLRIRDSSLTKRCPAGIEELTISGPLVDGFFDAAKSLRRLEIDAYGDVSIPETVTEAKVTKWVSSVALDIPKKIRSLSTNWQLPLEALRELPNLTDLEMSGENAATPPWLKRLTIRGTVDETSLLACRGLEYLYTTDSEIHLWPTSVVSLHVPFANPERLRFDNLRELSIYGARNCPEFPETLEVLAVHSGCCPKLPNVKEFRSYGVFFPEDFVVPASVTKLHAEAPFGFARSFWEAVEKSNVKDFSTSLSEPTAIPPGATAVSLSNCTISTDIFKGAAAVESLTLFGIAVMNSQIPPSVRKLVVLRCGELDLHLPPGLLDLTTFSAKRITVEEAMKGLDLDDLVYRKTEFAQSAALSLGAIKSCASLKRLELHFLD